MSFGGVDDPNGDDPGDNGTSAGARAVNQAAEAGIVPVAAIGNDGRRRVSSVGAADQAITVGSKDRKSTPSELQSHSELVCRLLLEKKKHQTLLSFSFSMPIVNFF